MTTTVSVRAESASQAPKGSKGTVPPVASPVEKREAWFAALPLERKEAHLFELEMLLHGMRALAEPRNQPGPTGGVTDESRNPERELRVLRAGMSRVVQLVSVFLGEAYDEDEPRALPASVPPESGAAERDKKPSSSEETPPDSLRVLRASLLDLAVMHDALAAQPASLRNMTAFHSTLTRLVEHNAYFHPALALEFRSEFDRIRHPEVLDALHSITSTAAHQVTAITLLSLFRGIRYVESLEGYLSQPQGHDAVYILLAGFRADVRALTRFVGRKARDLMADGLERELLSIRADEIVQHHETLLAQAKRLVSLRAALDTMATSLRIEVRRAFERELPVIAKNVEESEFGAQIAVIAAQLRAAFEQGILLLCEELRPGAPKPALAHGTLARKAASDRLRRDVWMFAQVLRAFIAKAGAAEGANDRWGSHASFQFVREFHRHFRAIGYQLVRMTDYQRLKPFLLALDDLRGVEILDATQMKVAVAECTALQEFLEHLFQQITKRKELLETPFDRKGAVEALKLYLQAS